MCSDFLKMCSAFGRKIFVHSDLGNAKKVNGPLYYDLAKRFKCVILVLWSNGCPDKIVCNLSRLFLRVLRLEGSALKIALIPNRTIKV